MGFRTDAAGLVWQPCPRCGQERIPSAEMIRHHDEFCPALHPQPAVLLRDTDEDRERLAAAVHQMFCVEVLEEDHQLVGPWDEGRADAIIAALRERP